MATIERFEDIKAWQAARDLVTAVYRVSGRGKFEKDFGLRDQIRRASVSVMSNIAEGFERSSDREFHRFCILQKDRQEKCAVSCSWRWTWAT
ncbi:MAG: four helix bundle protein [Nitrospiraceae bacterium]|nr:four helix bundle protein [Nitrospiraceae bacterium]